MRNTKYRILVLLPLFFVAFACEDFLGGDFNGDPNKPLAVPVTGLLPAAELVLVDTYGGDHSRFNTMLIQQVEGVARQWSSFNQYDLTPNRFNSAWENLYEAALINLNDIQAQSVANEYNHYLGIANVLEAFGIMMGTDVWDDMPYTEAALGADNTNPIYDTQASIYTALHALLDEAIVLFAGPVGNLEPMSDDFIYGGDAAKWALAAHGLKARAYLHFGEYANALTEAQASFTSDADDMSFTYPDANSASQWFRFNRDRTGDLEFHPTMRGIMTGLNDTDRLAQFDQPFVEEHTYLTPDYKQDLISYREIQFIIAEAGAETGAKDAVIRDAYLAGIDASFQNVGFEANSSEYKNYVAQASVDPGLGSIGDAEIMLQKYIGLFVQPEAYSDWRRKGIPALTPVTGSKIPVRWDYSDDSYLYNSNSPTEGDIDLFDDNVGWDN